MGEEKGGKTFKIMWEDESRIKNAQQVIQRYNLNLKK